MPNLEELQQQKRDCKETFSTDAGKRTLANLERLCFIHGVTFSPNPHITSFNEGKRAVVVQIQNMMSMDIEKLRKQLKKEEDDV